MSEISGFINPDLQPKVPKWRVSKPLGDLAKVSGKQQAAMFNQGVKASTLNPLSGLGRGAVNLAKGANVPLAIASAVIPLAEATGDQQVATQQGLPREFSTQTKPATGLGWEKPGQSYATAGITPTRLETGSQFNLNKGRMPIHWGKGSLGLPLAPPKPDDQSEIGPPLSARNPEGGGGGDSEFSMPSALPYDPRFEQGVNANYARATDAIDSRMKPAVGTMQGLLNEFRNYTPTGKSSIGAQTALNAIMGLTPQVAALQESGAKQVGALPLMQQGLDSMRAGAAPMQQSQVKLFEEKLPSTQAAIKKMSDEAKYRQMVLNQKEKESILRQQGKLSDTELHPSFSKGRADMLQQMLATAEDPAIKTNIQKMLFDELQKGEYTPIRRSASALGSFNITSEDNK